LLLVAILGLPETATAQKKPNILVIFGDDIGQTNISAYSMGVMGYRTPNIDRLAKEGMMFTDYYAENSCTAGRSTFITGEVGFRTGLLKVGIPGAKEGLQKQNITIAEALKPLGYSTGQFGKNHLGDRDEFLLSASSGRPVVSRCGRTRSPACAPKFFNLRMDPYERADIVSDQYYDWFAQNAYVVQYTLNRVKPFLASLKEYPPSQQVGSFSIDQMMEALERSISTTGQK
jgi:arylsulfatase A-like enzyme